ncbi:hypothetical protein FNU76_03955 [Chitinimonas arctica]|uniref:Uncharacterized protein n=1 Tax=Chitinimonas arctica TaxID=2594795 RepID=A0A516SBP9_9NEIS|nr:hypothetical protein [Chitinimonas arctica]QDQ25572.1 hypothetical protein FNU76_03955 [Chitinimonas arctica]
MNDSERKSIRQALALFIVTAVICSLTIAIHAVRSDASTPAKYAARTERPFQISLARTVLELPTVQPRRDRRPRRIEFRPLEPATVPMIQQASRHMV